MDQRRIRRIKSATPKQVEDYLRLQPGAFDHIPHYAREGALMAINNVMEMEKRQIFREGLYYIVLSDLCGSTAASAALGNELGRLRVESFILTCIEALGAIDPQNYFLPIREVGDAMLITFSSFSDVYRWWATMHEYLAMRNLLWSEELDKQKFNRFSMSARTVIHAGEVAYSDENIPIALAVNQVFKVEKKFLAGELGMTHIARVAADPALTSLSLKPRRRGAAMLPGDSRSMPLHVIAKWK